MIMEAMMLASQALQQGQASMTMCSFQKVLQEIDTPAGTCTLRLMCTGKITCGCPGEWEDILAFLERSLSPEEVYLRYFSAGNVRTKEQGNKNMYWRIIGAFVGDELAGLCYIGVNRVRMGRYAWLNDTNVVDLAYVVFEDFRGLRLAEHLTDCAVGLCQKHFVGASIEIEALRENRPMLKVMRRMGQVHYMGDEVHMRIELRKASLLDVFSDCVATSLGVWHSYATLPLRRASDACTRYAKLRKAA